MIKTQNPKIENINNKLNSYSYIPQSLLNNPLNNRVKPTYNQKDIYDFTLNLTATLNNKTETEIKQDIKAFLELKKQKENLNYDLLNTYNNIPIVLKSKKPLYNKDITEYHYIKKTQHYKDISILQILKVLYSQHKISKILYKDTIKRINHNIKIKEHKQFLTTNILMYKNEIATEKPLKLNNKVIEHINSYYNTIKAITSKNNITALNRKATAQKTPQIILKHNEQTYKVYLKSCLKHRLKPYSEYITEKINTEFNHKIQQDNNLIFNLSRKQILKELLNNNKINETEYNETIDLIKHRKPIYTYIFNLIQEYKTEHINTDINKVL